MNNFNIITIFFSSNKLLKNNLHNLCELCFHVDATVMADCKFDFSGNYPDEPAAIR
jgi:hypothetical protein